MECASKMESMVPLGRPIPLRKQEIEFLLGVLPGFSAALLALQIRLVDSLRTGPGCCLVS
jgi:hypothetical protein